MADQAASFIPKNSKRADRRVRTTKRIYLLSYISYVAFFGALIATAGTYLYANQVENELSNIKQQVQEERQRFASNEVVDELKLLDHQLKMVTELVETSAAPSSIFEVLETVTASNISFSALSYEYLPNRQYEIMLTGQAENFNQILYQEELMGDHPLLANGRIVSYDYSLKEDEGSSAENISGFATLTFIFSDTNNASEIPYVPDVSFSEDSQTEAAVENIVGEVTVTTDSEGETETGSADASATVTEESEDNNDDTDQGI